jgi:hypothetical protein
MAKIGAALPSMIGDTALKASYAQRYGTKSTTSFLSELGRSMGAVFASPDALDKQTLAAEFGIRLQNSLTPLGMEYHELAGTGKLAKWNQMVMKASGHSWGSNAMRTDTLSAEGFRQHQFASREWEALPEGRRDLMSQFGISKEMWDVMRQAEPLELDGGKKIMAPSQIRAMDPEAFRSIAKGDSDGARSGPVILLLTIIVICLANLPTQQRPSPTATCGRSSMHQSSTLNPGSRSFTGAFSFSRDFSRTTCGTTSVACSWGRTRTRRTSASRRHSGAR